MTTLNAGLLTSVITGQMRKLKSAGWIRSGKIDHKKALEHYNQAVDAVITIKSLSNIFWDTLYMGDISQGVQSLNLMSLFKSPLGPFFGDLELCYGKNWNSFWKYLSGEVCTYLSLDHPCTGGLFQGPYILLSLKYFLWFTAISRAFLWHQKPITGIVWEHVYIVHVLAGVYCTRASTCVYAHARTQ